MSTRAASADLVAVRRAVTSALGAVPAGATVLVGCSGGPDSLALVAAVGWAAPRRRVVAHAVVVDHGLQAGSGPVARWAAGVCDRLGVPARVVEVLVGTTGGPEAAARDARRAALVDAARAVDARAILLGHTREDQAETVLLRLARGSGARSLAAMAGSDGLWGRPFLDLPRAVVRAAAFEALAPLGERPWDDPHNADPRYARVRVRGLLDRLEADLGPGVVAGLARSARLLRADADALDALADVAFADLFTVGDGDGDGGGVCADCAGLLALPAAVRSRTVRLACRAVGGPHGLDEAHVQAVTALVTDWHGQGAVALPGGVEAVRACGRLCLRPRRPRPGEPSGA